MVIYWLDSALIALDHRQIESDWLPNKFIESANAKWIQVEQIHLQSNGLIWWITKSSSNQIGVVNLHDSRRDDRNGDRTAPFEAWTHRSHHFQL